MQSSQRLRQLLVALAKRRKRAAHKLRSTTQRRRQQRKATLAAASPQLYAMFACFIGGSVAGSLDQQGDFD